MEIILSHDAKIPKKGSSLSAGFDLEAKGIYNPYTKESFWFDELEQKELNQNCYVLKPGKRVLVKTGIQINMESDIRTKNLIVNDFITGIERTVNEAVLLEAQVRSRSGLALKKGIFVLNSPGTIDQDYKDDIGVILYNSSDEDFVIYENDRIAQLVFNVILDDIRFNEVKIFTEGNDRNGGFGSTDNK